MPKALPGKTTGFWEKTKLFLSSLFQPAAYTALKNQETARVNIAANEAMEERRQEQRVAEMKLQYVQHREREANLAKRDEDNRRFQAEAIMRRENFDAAQRDADRRMQAAIAAERMAFEAEQKELDRRFQAEENKLNRKFQQELAEFRAKVDEAMQNRNFDFQRWSIEQQRELQLHLRKMDAELQWDLRQFDRATQLQVIEKQKQLNQSPIWLTASQIIDPSRPPQKGELPPLRVLFSPLTVPGERIPNLDIKGLPDMTTFLNKELREFFDQYAQAGRPLEFLTGAWTSKSFREEAAASSIFSMLQSEPTLILEALGEGQMFYLHFAYWGASYGKCRYKTALSVSWREVLFEFAKQRTLAWQKRNAGKSDEELEKRYGAKTVEHYRANIEIIEREAECLADGEDLDEIERPYHLHQKDFDMLQAYLATCHKLVAGLLADEYFLVDAPADLRKPPILPGLLPELLELAPPDACDGLIELVVTYYQQLYQYVGRKEALAAPLLALDVVENLLRLPSVEWAAAHIRFALRYWLTSRRQPAPETDDLVELIAAVFAGITIEDAPFAERLNACLEATGATERLHVADACYQRGLRRGAASAGVRNLDFAHSASTSNVSNQDLTLLSAAIRDFDQAIQLRLDWAEAYYERSRARQNSGVRNLDFAVSNQDLTLLKEQAAADAEKAVELKPDWAEAHFILGQARFGLAQHEAALAAYQAALRLKPEFEEARRELGVTQGVLNHLKQEQAKRDEEARQRKEAERLRREEAERQRQAEEARRREIEARIGTEFSFNVVIIDKNGKRTGEKAHTARQKIVALANGVTLEMVYLPGGTFQMGSPDGVGSSDEHPRHAVTLAPFYMAKTPITQAQWQAIMGGNPSNWKEATRPVEQVSWNDCQEFVKKLNANPPQSPLIQGGSQGGWVFRLPTEAEWEYACRAGSQAAYCFGDNADGLGEYAWFDGNAGGQTHPVGQKSPNAFGLYDMHGNVWEWCQDVWHGNYDDAPSDGSAWEQGGDASRRLLRGGSWINLTACCRSAFRLNDNPDYRYDLIGVRVLARTQ